MHPRVTPNAGGRGRPRPPGFCGILGAFTVAVIIGGCVRTVSAVPEYRARIERIVPVADGRVNDVDVLVYAGEGCGAHRLAFRDAFVECPATGDRKDVTIENGCFLRSLGDEDREGTVQFPVRLRIESTIDATDVLELDFRLALSGPLAGGPEEIAVPIRLPLAGDPGSSTPTG